jgi:DNA-binding MarR family transcriptional regulator
MFTLLEARLAQELIDGTGLSMADYSVLTNLVEAENRRWRVTELADHMRWSQSRLSHQVRRMEERGLLKREPAADDGRGSFVVIANPGVRAIAAAAPKHFAGVRAHLIDLLTPEQVRSLAEIAEIVTNHLADDDPPD